MEKMLLGDDTPGISPTCLRFATVYGVAPRMRFDLTVNEFTRDLWAGRELEVFGEQFWRPYIHVARRRPRGARRCSRRPSERSPGNVFNAGHSDENYRKLDLVELIIGSDSTAATSSIVHRDEDPRDYKVSFDKIEGRARLRDADDASPTGSTRSSPRSRRTASATPSTSRYTNIP